MCVGCVVLFPVAIAVQAQTFSEYLIQGFRIEICDAWAAYMAKKLLGFALICKCFLVVVRFLPLLRTLVENNFHQFIYFFNTAAELTF